MNVFSGKCGIALGTKPILSFAGDQWESEITLKDQTQIHFKKIRNLFLDFFRGENVTNIRKWFRAGLLRTTTSSPSRVFEALDVLVFVHGPRDW